MNLEIKEILTSTSFTCFCLRLISLQSKYMHMDSWTRLSITQPSVLSFMIGNN
jgi:hypothetical protein